MFTIIDVPQRSPAWFAARCGRLTASCAADMLSVIAKGEAAARRNLRLKLVLEKLTGKPQENGFDNEHMQRGRALEPVARDRYEVETGALVREVGFLAHTELAAGASPDGLIMQGDAVDGVLEIKAPIAALHFEAFKSKVPTKHLPQLMHHFFISGATYVDFVSYCEDFPEKMQFLCTRLQRADFKDDLAAYERAVKVFLAEVDAEYEKVAAYAR